MRRLLFGVSLLALGACRHSKAEAEQSPVVTVSAAAPPAAAKSPASKSVVAKSAAKTVPKLEPLIEWRDESSLQVPEYGNAAAWAPAGATSPRPIVLGVHGNAETPEDFCRMLHGIVGTRAFVLCPRGVRPPDRGYPGYTWTSPQNLALEVDADIHELDRHYPGYVNLGSLLYVGFSRGAYLSVPIIATEPGRYSRAILIEGGQDAWTEDRVNMYGAEGGARILFACGQEECMHEGTKVADKLELVGVETRVAFHQAGHVYTGPVAVELRSGFDWVIAGDPNWN